VGNKAIIIIIIIIIACEWLTAGVILTKVCMATEEISSGYLILAEGDQV
jgi:hypothetical protein